jgi:uncharacterized protein YkwD
MRARKFVGFALALALSAVPAGAVEVVAADVGAALNALRAEQGFPALRQNAKAEAAARAHARDMARRGFFSHAGSNGGRLKTQGCRFRRAAEKIGKGQRSEAEVVAGWATSAGHRANILGPMISSVRRGRATSGCWCWRRGAERACR